MAVGGGGWAKEGGEGTEERKAWGGGGGAGWPFFLGQKSQPRGRGEDQEGRH